MKRHPENTEELFAMANLRKGSTILDMGAGDGSSSALFPEYEWTLIDIAPVSEKVAKADMLALPFPDESFDAVLSQCAFFASGNPDKAMAEAMRVLKTGGKLLLSDVFFREPDFPADERKDITPQWREYYFDLLWSDESPEFCHMKGAPKYYLILRTKNGSE